MGRWTGAGAVHPRPVDERQLLGPVGRGIRRQRLRQHYLPLARREQVPGSSGDPRAGARPRPSRTADRHHRHDRQAAHRYRPRGRRSAGSGARRPGLRQRGHLARPRTVRPASCRGCRPARSEIPGTVGTVAQNPMRSPTTRSFRTGRTLSSSTLAGPRWASTVWTGSRPTACEARGCASVRRRQVQLPPFTWRESVCAAESPGEMSGVGKAPPAGDSRNRDCPSPAAELGACSLQAPGDDPLAQRHLAGGRPRAV
jgi:hypothetical protein